MSYHTKRNGREWKAIRNRRPRLDTFKGAETFVHALSTTRDLTDCDPVRFDRVLVANDGDGFLPLYVNVQIDVVAVGVAVPDLLSFAARALNCASLDGTPKSSNAS